MKKHLFFSLVGALALSACSSEEPANNGNGGENTEGSHFLTVNVVATPDNGGPRATGDPNNNATYEEGFASENKVESVRFYFFNKDGKAASVKSGSTVNYMNYTPKDAGQDMPNVEKQLEAVLVIHKNAGDAFPAKIVAVINPQSVNGLGEGSLDLSNLRNKYQDFVASAKTSTDSKGAFAMINSVYATSINGDEITATEVSAESYQPTEELAKKNPVHIFVERCVAKVRLKWGSELGYDNTKGIALKDKEGNPITVSEKQVYFKADGWNLTAESNLGYLSKRINPTWSVDLFYAGSTTVNEPWNWAPYHRSYWAINAPKIKQEWPSFNALKEGSKNFTGNLANSIYTNENVGVSENINWNGIQDVDQGKLLEPFTKVVIGGILQDENGNALTICKYAGLTVVGEDNLKKAILSQLQLNNAFWTGDESSEVAGKRREIAESDVEFKTARELGLKEDGESNPGHYYVYMQLTEAAAKLTWYDKEKEGIVRTEPNKTLLDMVAPAQIHKDGMTYYYFPIRHLGTANNPGYYGVVRNHIYDCVINSIAGLGTPVYNPGENIWPEKPQDEDTFIAAKINILSWRVVPNNVELKW